MTIRLLILVEGDTEEGFVNRVLGPHLWRFAVFANATKVTTKRHHGQSVAKGGGRHYSNWKNDLRRLRMQDANPDRWLTSMIDLYGLEHFADEFPGFSKQKAIPDPYQRVTAMQDAFAADIEDRRFIPYIQLHEFESLLFADPRKLEVEYLEHEAEISRLETLSSSVASPELINDGVETSPSKRIIHELPQYEANKPRVGTLVTQAIGIPTLRAKCPHFDKWVGQLERLS